MRRIFLYLLALATLVPVLCCGSSPPSFHPSPGISLLPTTVSLAVGQTQDFEGVAFNTNSAVIFSVDGGDAFGTIDAAGLYTAPATVPPEGRAVVRARLADNGQVQETSEVEILAAPPAP